MNRSERNKTETIETIKRSFIALYAKEGIEKMTVKEICEASGISRAIFYRYFDDKYSILEDIENSLLERGLEFNKEMIGDNSVSLFYQILDYSYKNRLYFKPLLGPYGDPQFTFRWKKYIQEDVKRKMQYDKNNVRHLNMKVSFIASGIIGLFTYWFYEEPTLSVEEMSEYAAQMVSQSFYQ